MLARLSAASLPPNHDDALPFRGGQAPRQTSYLEPGTAVSTGRRLFIWKQQKGLEDVQEGLRSIWGLRLGGKSTTEILRILNYRGI